MQEILGGGGKTRTSLDLSTSNIRATSRGEKMASEKLRSSTVRESISLKEHNASVQLKNAVDVSLADKENDHGALYKQHFTGLEVINGRGRILLLSLLFIALFYRGLESLV